MPSRRTSLKLGSGLLLLFAAACSESPASLDNGGLGLFPEVATLSVFLTDAPGGVDAVWADIEQLTIQGNAGKFDLIESPTGLIEITELISGQLEQLVNSADLPAGTYTSLRAIIGDAVLVDEAGGVFVKGTPDLESILDPSDIPDVLGDLSCPSCTSSGFKVILPGGQTVLEDGVVAMVLDFDVTQSFGKASGGSGGWVMDPVIVANKVSDANGDGNINDDLALEPTLSGSVAFDPLAFIFCTSYTPTVQDFIPTATSQSLTDDQGQPIVRTAVVGADGAFSISPLPADGYDMAFMSQVAAGGTTVTFEATVAPAAVDATAGAVDGVVYTITSASCMGGFPF